MIVDPGGLVRLHSEKDVLDWTCILMTGLHAGSGFDSLLVFSSGEIKSNL